MIEMIFYLFGSIKRFRYVIGLKELLIVFKNDIIRIFLRDESNRGLNRNLKNKIKYI